MPDLYKISFLDKAKDDITEIYRYISETFSSPRAANNLMDEIDKSISYLEQNPMLYPLSKIDGYRKCVVKNYIVIYRVDDINKEILIVRVFHGTQNYENHF
jgi:addiction module RelE/StbE family toxin